MLKEALKYLVNLGEANIKEINYGFWSDKPLHRIDKYIPMAEPLCINTLTSLIDYIKSGADLFMAPMII